LRLLAIKSKQNGTNPQGTLPETEQYSFIKTFSPFFNLDLLQAENSVEGPKRDAVSSEQII